MHVEQNVFYSILKYLFGERDTMEVRKDMEEAHCHDLSLGFVTKVRGMER
jgi:hypothetical protein